MSDSSREMIIRIVVDDAAARQQTAKFHESERAQIKRTQAEKDKSDNAYVRAIEKKLAAGKQLEASINKQAKQEQDAIAQSEAAYVRATLRKLSAEKQLDVEKDRGAKREAADSAASEAAYVRATLKKLASEKQLDDQKARDEKNRLAGIEKEESEYVASVYKRLKAEKQLDDQKAAEDKRERAAIKAEEDAYVAGVYKKLRAEKQLDDLKVAEDKKHRKAIEDEEKAYVSAVYKQLAASKQLESEEARAAESRQAGIISITKMGAAFLGLQSASQIVSTFVDHFDKIRLYAGKTADDVQRMRESLRELAALRGEMGITGPTLAHVSDVTRQTLQRPQEVEAMEQAAIGVGELAIGKSISKGEFDKSLVAAGRMQTLEGGSSDAYGQMVGQIALQSDHEMKAEEVEARLDRMFKIQQPGGFRTFTQASQQYAQLNPLVMNKILSPEEAMGTLSAFSVSNPAEASSKTEQLVRATLANQIRSRGMKVGPDIDIEKTNEYFKRIKADQDTNPIKIVEKIAADLKQREASAKAAGKDFSAYKELELHGFANQQDILAIMDMAGMINTDNIAKINTAQNAPLEMGAPDKGPISTRFNARQNDPFMQRRKTEVAEQLADTQRGVQEEPLQIALQAAHARLKRQGKLTGSYEEWRDAGWLDRTTQDMLLGGKHLQVYSEAGDTLRRQLRERGDTKDLGFTNTEDTLRGLATRVQQSGGDLTAGTAKDMADSAASIKQSVEEFKGAVRDMNGGAKPAAAGGHAPAMMPPPNLGALRN